MGQTLSRLSRAIKRERVGYARLSLPNRYAGERVWSNSHSGLVSTSPGISWTGNWFKVVVTTTCTARRKLLNRTSLTIKKLPARVTDTIVLTVQDQLAWEFDQTTLSLRSEWVKDPRDYLCGQWQWRSQWSPPQGCLIECRCHK